MRIGEKLGYSIGILCSVVMLIILLLPEQASLSTPGPTNTGHEALKCQDCHLSAAGNARQQIQANIRYWLGWREKLVDFQHQAVNNKQCQACHINPKDTHPVHRFNEPRFAKARKNIQPHYCVSCHREHKGGRVTNTMTFCKECHQDLVLKNEPLEISHEELTQQEHWTSCLGCHDFHGNHIMEEPSTMDKILTPNTIINYFKGSPSPYSDQKNYQAKEAINQ